jgi:hypothetical protein
VSPSQLLTYVANRPEVLRGFGHDWEQHYTEAFLQQRNNIMLGDERGVALFFGKGAGVYQGHYLFTEALRGRAALLRAKEFLGDMFTTHGACVIKGTVPRSNRASRALTRALGFRPIGTSIDSFGRPCLDYTMDREPWVTLLATSLAAQRT